MAWQPAYSTISEARCVVVARLEQSWRARFTEGPFLTFEGGYGNVFSSRYIEKKNCHAVGPGSERELPCVIFISKSGWTLELESS